MAAASPSSPVDGKWVHVFSPPFLNSCNKQIGDPDLLARLAQVQSGSLAWDWPQGPRTGDQVRKAQCSPRWGSTQPGHVTKGDACPHLGEPGSHHAQGKAVTRGPTAHGRLAGSARSRHICKESTWSAVASAIGGRVGGGQGADRQRVWSSF